MGRSFRLLSVDIGFQHRRLICASLFLRACGDTEGAVFAEAYADYLEALIEAWTTTTTGELLEGTSNYYMRIIPEKVGDEHPAEDKETRILHIANHAASEQSDFPARNVVDGGFLELVRYGIRKPDDPLILATGAVIDAVLKVDTPAGPAWHRYNHDGYGHQADGQPFTSHGVGRVWPLLAGERGHYELAAGRSPETCIRAMEGLASKTGLLPEQSWDEADRPGSYMWMGLPTGSAMPLMWAHAEYVSYSAPPMTAESTIPFRKLPNATSANVASEGSSKFGNLTGMCASCDRARFCGCMVTSHSRCTGLPTDGKP